ncbi:uncharacterized protein LOC113360516 [Papaver somniferum]|uniref:uncharacterized protein LOC113360516 n=1 Tax=Papaver somniferum TaxID=3469 RepID=UPI000E6FF637|nr:uncharacterized protein LOC113360516 [Papaver somniferum]
MDSGGLTEGYTKEAGSSLGDMVSKIGEGTTTNTAAALPSLQVFGDVQVKIKEVEERFKLATQVSDNNPFDDEALQELVKAQNEHASREAQANTLLRQKSRVKRIKEGAANTIKKFEFQPVDGEDKLLEVIPNVINEEDQQKLDVIPEEEEIKRIVFEMDPESAPGPDGFSGIFYRRCWEIIKEDLVEAIQFSWRRKFIPKGINSSFLVLLPKTQGVKTANQFRPIDLSNVIFKKFTKIITKRMSELMEKLISPQQVAYVQGRSIHEQVLLASELVNEMKFKRRGGNIAIKLDISQAYDTVIWDF